MSVKERYGTMMDNAFGGYYDLFRKQKALSSDMAVTMEKLQPVQRSWFRI